MDLSCEIACNNGFCTKNHGFAYKPEYWMVLNLDTQLISYKIVSERVLQSIYIILRNKNMLNNQFSMKNTKMSLIAHIAMHGAAPLPDSTADQQDNPHSAGSGRGGEECALYWTWANKKCTFDSFQNILTADPFLSKFESKLIFIYFLFLFSQSVSRHHETQSILPASDISN